MPALRFKLPTLFLLLALVAFLLGVVPMASNWLMGFDRAMQTEYNRLAIGDWREFCIGQLGTPMSSGPDFSRELGNYSNELAKAKSSGSVEFLVWRNGSNWFYCIGFDSKGRLKFKAEGHS